MPHSEGDSLRLHESFKRLPVTESPDCAATPVDPKVELSIVMPCLNESQTLEECIRVALEAIRKIGLNSEIVIADNGSSDGSQSLAQSLGARVVAVELRGYGSALRGGILASRGEFVVMGDCDGSYDFGHAARIVGKLREGNDLVMGNRFRGGIEKGAMPWKHRYIGNPVLTGIGRLLFRCPVGDFHCGLRGLRRSAFERLDLNTPGMEFASEMVIKAALADLRIAEVPTVLRPDGRDRAPHLRSYRDGWRHLRFMLLFSPRWLFFFPGCGLAVAGLFLMGIISLGSPARIAGITLSVNSSIAASMLLILGCQLVMTGLFARVLATRIGVLPPCETLSRWSFRLTLETGVAAGLVTAVVGTLLLVWATLIWSNTGFSQLGPALTVQMVVPAMTLMVFGTQLFFTSFLFGLFGLTTHRPAARESSGVRE